jgi:hypothetical protein
MNAWLLTAFAGVTLLFVVMIVYSLALAWRGAMADRGPLLLEEMLARRGISSGETPALMVEHEIALAGRRCVLCASKLRCHDWLASAPRFERASFCPNAHFVDMMALRRRAV